MKGIFNRFRTYSGITGLLLLIALLAFVFHYPIQITDALNSLPVSGYDIKISVWRIIFEPFFGPLLFYLRADQPYLEFAVLLIWILAGLLIAKVSTCSPGMMQKLLAWLKKLPLLVSIWLGLLILMVFSNLPSNTIVNNLENTILVNTHSHTEYSADGIISQPGMQEWHKRNGFDAFFLTDHDHHEKSMEAVKAQEEGELPPSPLIMGGEEYSGSDHMSLLGIRPDFITRGLADQQVIDSVHHDKGAVIVNHWFDDDTEKPIQYYVDLNVDGFEIVNQQRGLQYDRKIFKNIVNACTENGLIMIAGADYHGYGCTCLAWNALDIPGWHEMDTEQKRKSILDVLRRRDMGSIKVLFYADRVVFDRSQVFLSPTYNFVNYFRTLNLLQVLSWGVWLILFRYSKRFLRKGNRLFQSGIGTMQVLEILAFLSSLFLLVIGLALLNRYQTLTDYNEEYQGYGKYLLGGGITLLVYTIILILFEIRNLRNTFRT